jgi:hypothetical protein
VTRQTRKFGWKAVQYAEFDELVPELRKAAVRIK